MERELEPTIDWEKAAGLKEEQKPRLLDNIAKHMPGWNDIGLGILCLALAFTAWNGGGIGIQMAPDVDPVWVSLGGLPKWMIVLLIWFGVDSIVFKGRASPWLLNKYVLPRVDGVLKAVMGEERYERLKKKLDKLSKKEEQEQ